MEIPDRVIERLSAYRRVLRQRLDAGETRIYSHELANLEGVTAAQVRRDVMTIGYAGSPSRGYDVRGLIDHISKLLNPSRGSGMVLVGMGHIGGALAEYFSRRGSELTIAAAFDVHPDRVGRVLHGCRCYPVDELERVVAETGPTVAILAVPAEAAQALADRLVRAGLRGLLNFAPVRLRVPNDVYVEDVDIAVLLEKVAFLAQARVTRREAL
jgi:redox-sensing transcriptional repressor